MAEQKKEKVTLTGQQMVEMLQLNKQKLDSLNSRIAELGAVRRELAFARDSLNELKKASGEQKILVNLGAGHMIEASTEKGLKVKYGIAGNVIKETTAVKAVEDIEKKINAVEKELDAVRKEQQTAARNTDTFIKALREVERQRRAQPQVG